MLIGMTGLKGSGKDTAAAHLVAVHGFTRVAFADLLKESLAAFFGITMEEIEEWKNDDSCVIIFQRPNGMRSTMTLRQALQRYGTEAHREIFGTNFCRSWCRRSRGGPRCRSAGGPAAASWCSACRSAAGR